MNMSGEQVGGIVRAIVSAVGGYLAGRGMVDGETVLTFGGIFASLGTAIWSVWAKKVK